MTGQSEFHLFADRLESIDQRLSAAQTTLSTIAARVERMDKHLEMQNGSIAHHDNQLKELERRVGEQESYVPLRGHLIEEQKELKDEVDNRVGPIEAFRNQVIGAWKLLVLILSIESAIVSGLVAYAFKAFGG